MFLPLPQLTLLLSSHAILLNLNSTYSAELNLKPTSHSFPNLTMLPQLPLAEF